MNSRSGVYHRLKSGRDFPRGMAWWPPLAMALFCLVLALFEPTIGKWFRYERELFEGGQIWRILTAHWVHAGAGHLWMNVLAIALLPLLCPQVRSWRHWGWRVFVLCLMVGLGLQVFNQGLRGYLGFSGVLHGIFVLVLLHSAVRGDGLSKIVLGLIAAKLLWEQFFGAFGTTNSLMELPVIVDAHLYGAMAGAGLWSVETLVFKEPASSASQ